MVSPVIVKIIEPKRAGLSEILIGAIGLAGVLALGALVLAVVFAAVMIGLRSRNPFGH